MIFMRARLLEDGSNRVYWLTGLSVDGDVQGVERLFGALAAHMWPGMILKSGSTIDFPDLVEKEGKIGKLISP